MKSSRRMCYPAIKHAGPFGSWNTSYGEVVVVARGDKELSRRLAIEIAHLLNAEHARQQRTARKRKEKRKA